MGGFAPNVQDPQGLISAMLRRQGYPMGGGAEPTQPGPSSFGPPGSTNFGPPASLPPSQPTMGVSPGVNPDGVGYGSPGIIGGMMDAGIGKGNITDLHGALDNFSQRPLPRPPMPLQQPEGDWRNRGYAGGNPTVPRPMLTNPMENVSGNRKSVPRKKPGFGGFLTNRGGNGIGMF